MAVIIKQTPDVLLVTYEDDSKYLKNIVILQIVRIFILKQFQSDKEVKFSCFVDENTLYAINT